MLLGRDREQARIDALLDAARRGRNGALVLYGEPGIGKTALLDAAEEHAEGMTVLRARGLEAETAIPFAALAELLRPALELLESIPPPQAAALAGALALGPSLPTGDPFATSAATLSLLGAAAERSPLLVVVDDAHWLDPSSATALLFAARRGQAEAIAFLFAAREGEPGFRPDGIEKLVVQAIDPESSRTLLAHAADGEIAPAVAHRLLELARGNPLALLETPGALTTAQLAGAEPLPEPLPVGRRLEETYLERVRRLPGATQTALLVGAASSGRMDEIANALAELGFAPDTLEPAEAAALVTFAEGRLAFRHPLLVSAIYQGASPAGRRDVHRALAAATEGEPRAWHLAAAATGPDEEAAAALDDAGASARVRGAHAAAGDAYDRAAALSGDVDARIRRTIAAASDFQLAGRLDRAQSLLEEALAATSDPARRAEIQHLRGRGQLMSGAPMAAYDLLVREARAIDTVEPDKAVMMLAEAAICATFAAEPRAALAAAEEAHALAHRGSPLAQLLATVHLCWALILPGHARRAEALIAPYEHVFETLEPLPAAPVVQQAAATWACLERYDKGRRLVTRLVDSARAAGAPGLLALPLAVLADIDCRTGRWEGAYARATESLSLAAETGQMNHTLYGLTRLAAVEAGRGDALACRDHVSQVLELAGPPGLDAARENTVPYLALLELGLGNPREAIRHLEPLVQFTRERGINEPAIVRPWRADLAEAYARVGRRGEALGVLADLADQAEQTGRRLALAAAARCRGLLAGDDAFEEAFDEAIAHHAGTETPFERARTLLCLGERLRRSGRRRDARERLRDALSVFEELGAEPWAARARAELQATGETVRRDPTGEEELTAQELQVALAIAAGATNREAAAALFLSPKTIEYHLTHVYRKLGVRSRSELARRFARELDATA